MVDLRLKELNNGSPHPAVLPVSLADTIGSNMSDTHSAPQPATWRIVLAAICDFLTAFFLFGYIIASIFGGRTEGGFQLHGLSALLLFALIAAYFILFNRFLGGTVWKRILRARRP
jgi:hypothetical protein